MANFDKALIELGKLVGFFAGSGDAEGTVQWAWFGNPVQLALLTMPGQRARIGAMLRELLESGDAAAPFTTGHDWQPVIPIDAIDGGIGVTWSAPDNPLAIGLGAKANSVGLDSISLGILAQLLRIQGG